MKRSYRSKALASVHEIATSLADVGVMDRQTLKEFDAMCLTPIKALSPAQIRNIRIKQQASQAVFARYLNVTTGLVSKWERGDKKPGGASLKLLTLVAKNGLLSVA
jgi:putative transcriptional regulator